MEGQIRRCKICGEPVGISEESIPYKRGVAHRKCFDLSMKIITSNKKENLSCEKKKKVSKPKPQVELKEGLTEEEYQEKRKLCDYIRELTKEDLSVATYKLMDDYKKKYKISYTEMYDDLKWYFDFCDHDVDGERVIAMVPLCHTEAQRYYKSVKETNALIMENLKELPDMYQTKRAVVSKRKQSLKEIDISTLGGDE